MKRSSIAGRASRVPLAGRSGTRPSTDPDAPVGNGRAIAISAAGAGASVASCTVMPNSTTLRKNCKRFWSWLSPPCTAKAR